MVGSASPIQDINTSAPILLAVWNVIYLVKLVSSYWPKFAALRRFVETKPIYKAVATGNRNNELYRETARSNWKKPSIATIADYSRNTVFILTPLIFRYHLPLRLTYGFCRSLVGWRATLPCHNHHIERTQRNPNFLTFRGTQSPPPPPPPPNAS
jgi:hypothetical protein